jgi:MFS family permease
MNGMTGAAVAGSETGGRAGHGRMMVARAFLAQNVAVGCAFGGFGVSVLPLQQLYGASTGTTTLSLALCVLVLGLVSPLIGALIGRIGLRWTMTIGTVISGAGYALLAIAPSMPVVLLLYALPIGVGLAMFGPFPASVLASNWYRRNPGTALGIANTPLFVALLPMVGLIVIRDHGLAAFYLTLAALHVALLPVMLGVSDAPAEAGQQSAHGHGHGGGAMMSARALLRRPAFWVISLGAGYLSAVGITAVSHLVAFVAERGVAASEAAGLLSIMGGAAVIGSLVIGFLCGRLGAPFSLGLIAAGLALSWMALLSTTSFPLMALASLMLGAGGAGVFPAVNMLSARLFGQDSLPRVIGLFGVVTLPLTFFLPPLAGVLRDIIGGYGPVAMILICGCVIIALLFFGMARIGRRVQAASV